MEPHIIAEMQARISFCQSMTDKYYDMFVNLPCDVTLAYQERGSGMEVKNGRVRLIDIVHYDGSPVRSYEMAGLSAFAQDMFNYYRNQVETLTKSLNFSLLPENTSPDAQK